MSATNTNSSVIQPRWLVLGLLGTGQLMLILDVTVVAIALPHMGTSLGISREVLTWVVSGYSLTFGGLLLLGGKAADRFGPKPVVLAGLGVFTAASLAAGLAETGPALLGGRAAQGVGAAMLSSAALSSVVRVFDGDERNRALGIWSALGGGGAALGVLLGGLITAGPGWPWVFFINVPAGVVVYALLTRYLPALPASETAGGRADVVGAAVPATPQWTITDLVRHVGQTQHWVAEIIERRITDPAQLPTEMAVLPAGPRQWQAWLSESAQRVASACSDDALDAPVFNPAGDDRPGTRFWMSSVLSETVVHGFDAASAAGRPAGIDAGIAAVLITSHLAMLTSPTWEMQRPESARAIRGTGQTLQWLATDTAGAWFVERRPDGATWQPGTRQADVTVTGPARSLLLTLTRRLPLTGREATSISVDGDTGLARHWLGNTAHVSG